MTDIRKHPCADCKMCQGCSESRCGSCRLRRNDGRSGRRLSISEQIALFNRINPELEGPPCECGCNCQNSPEGW